MKSASRASVGPKAKRPAAASATTRGTAAPASPRKRTQRSSTNRAITTELAPAVAIALLERTDQPAGAPSPALDCLAAGVSASQTKGRVRVQLMFENGAVLPVEMSAAAGAALSNGLAEELPTRK